MEERESFIFSGADVVRDIDELADQKYGDINQREIGEQRLSETPI
jgi:hypothetical protein